MTEISNLTLHFNNEIIFNNFSLKIQRGEKIALTGKSGKGKSTLLNLLCGFIPDYEGAISVLGKKLNAENVSDIRKNIAWLPQDTSLAVKTVNELFFEPFGFVLNKPLKPTKKEVTEIFSAFELSENLLTKKTNEISGGQKQRIILASCLLLKKPLLLADEPTSALDENIKRKMTDYILKKNGLTVIAATHDDYWIKRSTEVVNLM
ncbi:MAG: ATP-binding cassette domain-containing protein [Bacteroidales bacterium]|nr:ATP-binding cassette domain-containing protein [Bacteroidales bacterium]